jgi:putative component of toxin-antitoxin plasmid stabilization module
VLTVREYLDESGRSPFRRWLAELDQATALLLLGGDKSSQRKDIKSAQEYWATYLKETQRGTKK